MSEFTDYLKDVFAEFGPIRVRSMFGGYGVYLDDLMFGLVADDTLYLKYDEQTQADFDQYDLPAFEYEKKSGQTTAMSYRQAPEFIYDNPDDASAWAGAAWEAAQRAKAASKARKTVPRRKTATRAKSRKG